MMMFLTKMTSLLTRENQDWRDKTIFIMDGASYHKSDETRKAMVKLGLNVILSAPYSY